MKRRQQRAQPPWPERAPWKHYNPLVADAEETLAAIGESAPFQWDVLLVGDGSGSGWGHACGWASVSIERAGAPPRLWYGAANAGTVNMAEIMAYLLPLNWLAGRIEDQCDGKDGRPRRAPEIKKVWIVTDSQYCAQMGNKVWRGANAKNDALWSGFDVLGRQGLDIHWRWSRRAKLLLNTLADYVSRIARQNLELAATQHNPPFDDILRTVLPTWKDLDPDDEFGPPLEEVEPC